LATERQQKQQARQLISNRYPHSGVRVSRSYL